MKKMFVLGLFAISVSSAVFGGVLSVYAGRGKPDPAITFYRGTVTQVDPASWTLAIKTDEGTEYTFRVARFADLRLVAVGDRVEAEVITTWEVVLFLKKIPLVPRRAHTQGRQDGAGRAGTFESTPPSAFGAGARHWYHPSIRQGDSDWESEVCNEQN